MSTASEMPECRCDGNGWIECWDCGGSGEVMVMLDDITEDVEDCRTCSGHGGFSCPAHED
jgi:hypothetical protein